MGKKYKNVNKNINQPYHHLLNGHFVGKIDNTQRPNNTQHIINDIQHSNIQEKNNDEKFGFEYSGHVIMISPNEYQELLNENEKLRKELQRFINNETIFHSVILDKDKTINELREENKMLKNKLKSLEKQIDILNIKNTEHEKEYKNLKTEHEDLKINHENLKTEHTNLKIDHNDLKNEIQNMKNNKTFDKFIIAIQDLNRLELLETKVSNSTKDILQELRDDRIDDCHYINDNDTQQRKDDKRNILYDEIKSMPQSIKDMFDTEYPNLLNDIESFIINKKTIPTQKFIAKTKRWFYG
jgi:chromosome segregation ATPase